MKAKISREGVDPLVRLILAWRRALDVTQAQAAIRLRVPERTLAKWEQGVQSPTRINRARVLGLFACVGPWMDWLPRTKY